MSQEKHIAQKGMDKVKHMFTEPTPTEKAERAVNNATQLAQEAADRAMALTGRALEAQAVAAEATQLNVEQASNQIKTMAQEAADRATALTERALEAQAVAAEAAEAKKMAEGAMHRNGNVVGIH
ncbi:hypothetical protein FOA52_005511 [Chlamydomonas sp. UWO 241]|nr:hypothetical protein FOA52_005511 [Chlamydomonas sp. UWO 241]